MDWRASQRPDGFCRFVLEHSQVPEAWFYAMLTLNSSVVREWPLFSDVEKTDLKNFLIQYLLQRSAVYVVALLLIGFGCLIAHGFRLEFRPWCDRRCIVCFQ